MKQLFYFLIIGLTFIAMACNNDSLSNDSESKSLNDPKVLAQLTLDINLAGDDIDKHTALYKKYGFNLVEGSNQFDAAFNQVKNDPEQYKLYNEQLSLILKNKSIGDISIETKKDE